MKVQQFIKELEKLEPEALVMVATIDDNGDTQMVEANNASNTEKLPFIPYWPSQFTRRNNA